MGYVHYYTALVKINERDMEDHPNPNYERSLNFARKQLAKFRNDAEESTEELRQAIEELKEDSKCLKCCNQLHG